VAPEWGTLVVVSVDNLVAADPEGSSSELMLDLGLGSGKAVMVADAGPSMLFACCLRAANERPSVQCIT